MLLTGRNCCTETMSLSSLKRLLLGAALLSLPHASPAQQEQGAAELPLEELRRVSDAYNRIRAAYVEELDDSTLLEYAIQGMLSNLDPHSVYLSKDAFDDLQTTTTGEFTGLGIEVGTEDGYIKIVSPIDGSPAAEAGLMPGDVILKLDKQPVKGLGLNEAVEKMRGPKGSEIVLTIGRPGESQAFDVTLIRDTIKVASVRQRLLEPGYGYVRIAQFQNHTGSDVDKALKKLAQDGPLKGVVLDLRNNPGGVLQASVEVAGLFMDGGLVVYTEGRASDSESRFQARPGDTLDGLPLVVLINGGSASASEIVAGALQDHHRAVIMGTRSFGKGSVQSVMQISETRAIKLTTALYFTPSGRSIQAEGIEPDIEVERAYVEAYDTSFQLSEADLNRHLENAGDKKAASGRKLSSELLSSDNQLYEALTLLKGVNILGLRDKKAAPPTAAKS